ncbi:PAS domain-containing sensor histidine kinase [Rhodospirillum centenum]|uniref:PAS domain-containing sensor histidine kinase n=1 Tax=Rhodospirillum centenum TaxID=34018 RepID=UPI0011D0DC46|nr:HAMP domain-containing sensor histidine kinase [Rhodospirillum centenum]
MTPELTAPSPLPPALVQPLWEALDEAVVVTDAMLDPPGPTILYVNPAFSRLTGFGADDAVGRTPVILKGPGTDPRAFAGFKDTLRAGRPARATVLNYRRGGEPYLCEIIAAPLTHPDGSRGYIAVEREVQAAPAVPLADLRFREWLLAASAHDLQQPLNALTLLTGVLDLRAGDDPRFREPLDGMQAALASARDLCATFLDLGRASTGRMDVAAVALGPLLLRVAERHRLAAAAKGLVLAVVPVRAVVRSDPRLLERILDNLLSNAVRFTPAGRVLLGCRRRVGRLRIDVLDTGPGIDPASLPHLVADYRHGTGPESGQGLGLAISRRLCDALGHRLEAGRVPGGGARFSVTLDFWTGDGQGATAPVAP